MLRMGREGKQQYWNEHGVESMVCLQLSETKGAREAEEGLG